VSCGPGVERRSLRRKTKKGPQKQAFFQQCELTSTCAVRRAIEGNPLLSSGRSLLASESPIVRAFPGRQDLTSLSTGIGSFKYTPLIRTLQGSACTLWYIKSETAGQGNKAPSCRAFRQHFCPVHPISIGGSSTFSEDKNGMRFDEGMIEKGRQAQTHFERAFAVQRTARMASPTLQFRVGVPPAHRPRRRVRLRMQRSRHS